MTAAPLLAIEHLVKTFAVPAGRLGRKLEVTAVNDVSLSVPSGTVLGLVGESGSGKTTLGKCVLRLLDPTSGSITFDGIDLLALKGRDLREIRRRIQVVFQDPYGSLNPRMKVGRAVEEPLIVHRIARGGEAQDRVAAVFQEVGLDPDMRESYPHQLSGGQRQRVGIARALVMDPDFLVLDEPVSALDVSVQAQVLNLLAGLRERRGLTYLFIAHDLAVVRYISDQVAVMYLGRIVEVGPSAEVFGNPRHPYTASLLSAIPDLDPGSLDRRIRLRGDPPDLNELPHGCPLVGRCPHPQVDSRCMEVRPVLEQVGSDHLAACHHWESPLTAGL